MCDHYIVSHNQLTTIAMKVISGIVLFPIITVACNLARPQPSPPCTQTAAPLLSPTLTLVSTPSPPVDNIPLAYIPPGTFQMGEAADRGLEECLELLEPFTTAICQLDWFALEEPQHNVTLDAFWINTTEVTNAMYAQCVTDGACTPPPYTASHTRDSYYREATYEDYPVIYIDWHQAETYCEWAGGRLPTEAEWEYAARGGLAGQLYPWGDTFDGRLANFCDANCNFSWSNINYDDGFADTAPVGSYPANGFGLHDLAGNVWEWVADWYGPYSSSSTTNPTGADRSPARLLRGGSLDSFGSDLRVAARFPRYNGPVIESYDVGFRCVFMPTR